MKKRILTLLLATAMICGMFTACGGNNESTEQGMNQNDENEKKEMTAEMKEYYESIKDDKHLNHENVVFIVIKMGDNKPFYISKLSDNSSSRYSVSAEYLPQHEAWRTQLTDFKYSTESGYLWLYTSFIEGIFKDKTEEYPSLIYQKQADVAGSYYFDEMYGRVTEEEYNNVLDSCEWVSASEVEWYSDPESACMNAIILK